MSINVRDQYAEWSDGNVVGVTKVSAYGRKLNRPKLLPNFDQVSSVTTAKAVLFAGDFGTNGPQADLARQAVLMNPIIGSQVHTTGPLLLEKLNNEAYVELMLWKRNRVLFENHS